MSETSPPAHTEILPGIPNPTPRRDELLHRAVAHQMRLDGYQVCRPLPDEPRLLLATKTGPDSHHDEALAILCCRRHWRDARRLLGYLSPQLAATPVIAKPSQRRRPGLSLTRLHGPHLDQTSPLTVDTLAGEGG